MVQFDVYENPNTTTNSSIPYLLDVQVEFLDNLSTRVVVPLVRASFFGKAATQLNPQFVIDQSMVIMSTAELAGVSVRHLGKKVCSLRGQRDEIIAALDFLFTGF